MRNLSIEEERRAEELAGLANHCKIELLAERSKPIPGQDRNKIDSLVRVNMATLKELWLLIPTWE